jgi:hypothetical protein
MEAILTLVVIAFLFLLPIIVVGRWILGPIDRAAKFREAPVRFSIGDFLCLFLAVQLPLTAIYQLVGKEERPLFWLFTIITWVIAPVIWFACARALSKAGVSQGKHRFLFLGLVMPLVYYGLVPFIFMSIAAVTVLTTRGPLYVFGQAVWVGWFVLAWFVLAVVFYVCGQYTRWIVRQAGHGERPMSDLEHRLRLARAAIGADSQSEREVNPSGDL